MYIDTGSPVLNIPSKSRGMADENKKTFDGKEMIRNKHIGFCNCCLPVTSGDIVYRDAGDIDTSWLLIYFTIWCAFY